MFLEPFYQQQDGQIRISRAQASGFAKEIAGDFNPIHDVDAKRFCVPGDLLFALILSRYGLSQSMQVSFKGMVDADTPLLLPDNDSDTLDIVDQAGKSYLQVQRSGSCLRNDEVIAEFSRQYVQFSGQNFPFILVPLLRQQQVMFNIKRPFVIYDSMAFNLTTTHLSQPKLTLASASLAINGRRGDALFEFELFDGATKVGTGSKKLIVSGLVPYDEEQMQGLIGDFTAAKAGYQAQYSKPE